MNKYEVYLTNGGIINIEADDFSTNYEYGVVRFTTEGKVSLSLDESGTVRYVEDNRLELASKWNSRIISEAENER